MGKNRRERREEEREGFAAKRTAQYRSRNLKAVGILSAIGVIVAFACFEFITSTNSHPSSRRVPFQSQIICLYLEDVFNDGCCRRLEYFR